MRKSEAIQLLGGSPGAAAKAIGITSQAVSNWPDELTAAIRDRVQAVLWRRQFADGAEPAQRQQGAAAQREAA